MAFVVLFIQYLMVAVERTLVELIINESQLPLSLWNEQHQRTRRPVLDAYSSRNSEWDFDKIFLCCRKIVCSWQQSAATDGVCDQNTLTRHILSHLHALITVSHTTLAQDGCPHHVIHASSAVVVFILFDSPFCTLHRLSHLPFHSPHLPCGLVRGEVHCALPRMRS